MPVCLKRLQKVDIKLLPAIESSNGKWVRKSLDRCWFVELARASAVYSLMSTVAVHEASNRNKSRITTKAEQSSKAL